MNACEQFLLRIHLSTHQQRRGEPAFEALVEAARARGLAGATVLRGLMGFGHGREIHSAALEAVSTHLPVVVEIVDSEEKIRAFLPEARDLAGDALMTLERVQVVGRP